MRRTSLAARAIRGELGTERWSRFANMCARTPRLGYGWKSIVAVDIEWQLVYCAAQCRRHRHASLNRPSPHCHSPRHHWRHLWSRWRTTPARRRPSRCLLIKRLVTTAAMGGWGASSVGQQRNVRMRSSVAGWRVLNSWYHFTHCRPASLTQLTHVCSLHPSHTPPHTPTPPPWQPHRQPPPPLHKQTVIPDTPTAEHSLTSPLYTTVTR